MIITGLVSLRKICGLCTGCTSSDCGSCVFCLDMPKFGGRGARKSVAYKGDVINWGINVIL